MLPNIIGWDIGGAHLKVAIINDKIISHVHQLSCPLWKGIDELSACVDVVKKEVDFENYVHAITMTGELVDCFEDREQGVASIISEMSNQLSPSLVQYYAGNEGFISSGQAVTEHNKIASANWLASAHYVASKIENAFFIDIGSTTTDIVEVRDYKVSYSGYTDEQRLIARELVYCGVVRTPIFAFCKSAQVKGQQIPIINEYFANTADIYRITDELPAHADLSETLDGRDKDVLGSVARLARMFANDFKQDEINVWKDVAKQIRTLQLQMIKDACRHQFMKKNVPLSTPIVGAGVGRFLVRDLAQQLGREYIDFEQLFESGSLKSEFGMGDCAPAASVAYLALTNPAFIGSS